MFYKAYNQNAMWFVQHIKAYKVTAKYIKTIQQEECFIGFPIKYLNSFTLEPFALKKTRYYIYHPLIPKISTVILYIVHLFICMKIIEENVSTLELSLIKLVLMNKMCMLFSKEHYMVSKTLCRSRGKPNDDAYRTCVYRNF